MDLKIGNKIQKHRKKLGFTQENLANCLGVSIAAVSKWESGNSYPDITLLPEIAKIFNVSIDNLLGFDLQNEDLENILDKGKQFEKEGSFNLGIEFIYDGLKKYPNDFRLNRLLASMLLHVSLNSNPVDREKALEAMKYLDKCILLDVYDKNKESLIQNKSFILGAIKEYEKANELLLSLKNDRYTIQIASNLISMGKYDEAKNRLQIYLNDITFSFAWLCGNLIKCFRNDNRNKEVLQLLKMNASFREYMTLSNDPNYYNFLSSRDFLDIAIEAKQINDLDEMWKALEKSVEHAVRFDSKPSFAVSDVNFLYNQPGHFNNGNVLASKYIIKVLKTDFNDFSKRKKYNELLSLLEKR